MGTSSILILMGSLVIFSYLFDILSRKTRVPSVLMLLILGMGIRMASQYFEWPFYDFSAILPLLGTVGLILIVFEGALELRYEPEKRRLIFHAFYAALFLLLLTSLGIATLFYYFSDKSFYICMLNAIPFSVISSSIAIPSVASLQTSKKEFIIYESSFSDILGIMLFNLLLSNDRINPGAMAQFGIDTVLLIVLSLLSCIIFLFIMGRMKHHVKFFLIISALILVYAIGKKFHLSTLVTVLAFGLFLQNFELISQNGRRIPFLRKLNFVLLYPSLQSDLKNLHQLTAESAFLLRTFFFLVFGYSLLVSDLLQSEVFFYGTCIIMIVYILRWIYLRFIARAHLWPELLITPRGLISVLLFLSIPETSLITPFGDGILLYTILLSGILMTLGLITFGKGPTHTGDE